MNKPNPDYIRQLMHIVNTSLFPQHICMRLISIDFDHTELEMDITPQHFQAYGIVHGGVLATLIDTATFWSVYMRIPQDAGLVNIDLKLNYLEPVQNGKLTAVGTAIRSGKTISYAEAKVFSANGAIAAHGTSSLMTLPGKGLKVDVPKFL